MFLKIYFNNMCVSLKILSTEDFKNAYAYKDFKN